MAARTLAGEEPLRKILISSIIAVAAICLISGKARADNTNTISISDLNDTITATVNGQPVTLSFSAPEDVSFTFDRGGAPAGGDLTARFALTEPGSSVISDELQAIYTQGNTVVTVHFCSDPSTFAFCGGLLNSDMAEDGTSQHLFDVAFNGVIDSYNVASEATESGEAAVPEPASVVLITTGIAGIFGLARRNRH